MFAVFLYGTVPHEYLHDLFAQHSDTIDHTYQKGEFHFSNQHTHCAFLGIAFSNFLAAEHVHYLFEHISYICSWVSPVHQMVALSAVHSFSLRGPPVI